MPAVTSSFSACSPACLLPAWPSLICVWLVTAVSYAATITGSEWSKPISLHGRLLRLTSFYGRVVELCTQLVEDGYGNCHSNQHHTKHGGSSVRTHSLAPHIAV